MSRGDGTQRSQPLGGLILAGGQSARMGVDKATLQYRGRTLLAQMTDVLAEVGAEPVLKAGQPGGLVDPVANAGPVAGLIALADHVAIGTVPKKWLVVPVDMPLLSAGMLGRLVQMENDVAHFTDHPLPLVITLQPRVMEQLSRIKQDLEAQQGVSVWRVLRELDAAALAPTPDELTRLANVNTPAEWADLLGRQPP